MHEQNMAISILLYSLHIVKDSHYGLFDSRMSTNPEVIVATPYSDGLASLTVFVGIWNFLG